MSFGKRGPPTYPPYLSSRGFNKSKLLNDIKGKSVAELKRMWLDISQKYDNATMNADIGSRNYKRLINTEERIRKLIGAGKWQHAKELYKNSKQLKLKF